MVELAARRYSDRDLVKGLTLNTVSPSLSDGRLPQKAFQSQSLNRAKTPYPGCVQTLKVLERAIGRAVSNRRRRGKHIVVLLEGA